MELVSVIRHKVLTEGVPIRDVARPRQALAEGQHPLGFLRAALDAEIATRSEHAVERRLRAARLPARKTLSQFDWRRAHGLERARVEELARCAWIDSARNVVLVGPVGTGKTHLATALGIEAIKRGHHVLFFRASGSEKQIDVPLLPRSSHPVTRSLFSPTVVDPRGGRSSYGESEPRGPWWRHAVLANRRRSWAT
jgi:hypothetical protein